MEGKKRLLKVLGGLACRPLAKPICTEQEVTQLVGSRRLSMLQKWESGGLPRRFPVALKAQPEPWRVNGSG